MAEPLVLYWGLMASILFDMKHFFDYTRYPVPDVDSRSTPGFGVPLEPVEAVREEASLHSSFFLSPCLGSVW